MSRNALACAQKCPRGLLYESNKNCSGKLVGISWRCPHATARKQTRPYILCQMTTKRKCLVPSSNSLVLKMNRLFRKAECLVVPNASCTKCGMSFTKCGLFVPQINVYYLFLSCSKYELSCAKCELSCTKCELSCVKCGPLCTKNFHHIVSREGS